MYREINLTGGSYQDKSQLVSNQVTRNFWPKLVDDPITKNKYILESWVGQTLFGTADGVGRGTFNFNGLLYRVCGTTLYSVSSSGVHTSLGSIPGTGKVIFDGLGSILIIAADRRIFNWDGSSLSEVSAGDLESPDSVTVLNNQAIYDGDGGRFCTSDVGDPATVNGLNYATAESKADNLIRPFAFNERVYMFGESTIEQWQNSGIGNPPFDRVQFGIIEIGLASLHAIAKTVDNLYFFGTDRRIYEIKGAVAIPVSDEAQATIFAGYTSISDVILWCMTLRGVDFLVATFPTDNKSWVLPKGGQWFEWTSGVNADRNKANSYVNIYSKHLVEDFENGNIYELDFQTYTENGDTIARQRDSAPIDSALIAGIPGKKITMNQLILDVQAGVGLISGQGSDPVIMMSYSDDNGNTFSTERWGKIGKMGQYKNRVVWNNLGSFYERIFRFRITDPVYCLITKAGAEFEVGI